MESPTPPAKDNGNEIRHPDFCDSSADITLVSSDGTQFCVYSNVLKTASDFFKDMISLPQPAGETCTIPLKEDAATVEVWLRIICGMSVPRIDTFDVAEALLLVAAKYQTPGPTSIIRQLLYAPWFKEHPLRLYAIGCHFELEEIQKLASTLSLEINIFDPTVRQVISELTTHDLLRLIDLHRGRRTGMNAWFESMMTSPLSAWRCSNSDTLIANDNIRVWRELQSRVSVELERQPSGAWVTGAGIEEWIEREIGGSVRPSNPGLYCGRRCHIIDKATILAGARAHLATLPTTV